MANVRGRILEARKALMLDAARRWHERQDARVTGLDKLAAMGLGAADTPFQREQWKRREAGKAAMGAARFFERIVGTNDLVPFAPSLQAAAVATPVARIATLPDGTHQAEGFATGLLLPGGLLLTNYHVFPGQAFAVGFAANFGHARDERGINEGSYFETDPDSFFFGDSQFDFVLVALKAAGTKGESLADIGGTQLIEATGKVLTGMPVDIIQHPNGGPRQFGLSNNRLVDILPAGYLHYETDTEKGSSGAPVYNTDWELIALHHSGVPELKDGQVMTVRGTVWDDTREPDTEIHWIANEGIRVSFIVDRLKAARMDTPAQQAIADRLLAASVDPFSAQPPAPTTESQPQPLVITTAQGVAAVASPGNTFNFSGPVTMHVYAAGSSPTASAPVVAESPAVPASTPDGLVAPVEEKALLFDTDYAARKGYDPHFLGVEIPLPRTIGPHAAELYTVKAYRDYFAAVRNVPKLDTQGLDPADPLVLHFHHFSLAFNATYRMCMWTASNCDYRAEVRQDKRPRKELGGETWRYDPRVPRELQLADADVYQPARRVDRGHIVRREDNCWGPVGLPTDYANSDTYHWTNCTPQHQAFNQENPNDTSGLRVYDGTGVHGLWGSFEAEVADQIMAGGGQAVIFAGPVLKDFFEAQDWGRGKVRIPKQFWKVVIVPDSPARNPRLLTYGYVFSQAPVVKRFGMTIEEEALLLPDFQKQRKSLQFITALTGISF